jgi:hypothetical protein
MMIWWLFSIRKVARIDKPNQRASKAHDIVVAGLPIKGMGEPGSPRSLPASTSKRMLAGKAD